MSIWVSLLLWGIIRNTPYPPPPPPPQTHTHTHTLTPPHTTTTTNTNTHTHTHTPIYKRATSEREEDVQRHKQHLDNLIEQSLTNSQFMVIPLPNRGFNKMAFILQTTHWKHFGEKNMNFKRKITLFLIVQWTIIHDVLDNDGAPNKRQASTCITDVKVHCSETCL